jgi:hypothetical protein
VMNLRNDSPVESGGHARVEEEDDPILIWPCLGHPARAMRDWKPEGGNGAWSQYWGKVDGRNEVRFRIAASAECITILSNKNLSKSISLGSSLYESLMSLGLCFQGSCDRCTFSTVKRNFSAHTVYRFPVNKPFSFYSYRKRHIKKGV